MLVYGDGHKGRIGMPWSRATRGWGSWASAQSKRFVDVFGQGQGLAGVQRGKSARELGPRALAQLVVDPQAIRAVRLGPLAKPGETQRGSLGVRGVAGLPEQSRKCWQAVELRPRALDTALHEVERLGIAGHLMGISQRWEDERVQVHVIKHRRAEVYGSVRTRLHTDPGEALLELTQIRGQPRPCARARVDLNRGAGEYDSHAQITVARGQRPCFGQAPEEFFEHVLCARVAREVVEHRQRPRGRVLQGPLAGMIRPGPAGAGQARGRIERVQRVHVHGVAHGRGREVEIPAL